MNRTATTLPCTCYRPGTKASLSEESDIGITDDGWDVTRMSCTHCGTPWLCAYFREALFPRAGRYYRVPLDAGQLGPLTASAALQLIESSERRLAGGSRFSTVECLYPPMNLNTNRHGRFVTAVAMAD
jgi:hypothetical protein